MLRVLKKRLRELQELYLEAATILNDLLLSSSTDIARGLCERFHVLQEYFVMRYRQARALAIAALGQVEAALFFP